MRLISLRNKEWRKIWKVLSNIWKLSPLARRTKTLIGRNFVQFQKHSANKSKWKILHLLTMRAISNKLIRTSCPISHHHTSAHLLHVPAEISTLVYQGITSQNKQVNCNPESHCLLLSKGKLSTRRLWHWNQCFRELYQKLRCSREKTALGHGKITTVIYCLTYWKTTVMKETSVNKHSSNWQTKKVTRTVEMNELQGRKTDSCSGYWSHRRQPLAGGTGYSPSWFSGRL